MKRTVKTYDAKLKAKVAIDAIIGKKETIEISSENNVSKTTIFEWRDKLLNEAEVVFMPLHEREKQVKRHFCIKLLVIENNFFKKKLLK